MIKKKIIAFMVLLLGSFLLFGCSQFISAESSLSNAQPSGVTLRGTVREFTSNFEIGDPVPNAIVSIDGDSSAWSAVTNSKGEYVFAGIPDGSYYVSASAEGYATYVGFSGQVTVEPVALRSADNTNVTLDMFLFCFPTITEFCPVPDSVVSNDQVFSITFSATMDVSSVIIKLIPQGIRASAVNSKSTVSVDLSWSSDNKTVTITPNGNLVSNEVYRLTLAHESYNSKGDSGIWLWGPIFDKAVGYFADYRTESGGVPGAPFDLQVVINDKPISEVDFADVITGANKIKLSWAPASSGCITGYRIYVAKSGSVSNYTLLKDITGSASTEINYFTSNISAVITALYNGTLDPISTQNYPFVNDTIYFKVVAYNGDGESAGNMVSAKEAVGPQAYHFEVAGYQGGTLPNNYYLLPIDAADRDKMYIGINEPVDSSTIIKDNFSFTGSLSVESAVFLTNNGVSFGLSVVEITASGVIHGSGDTLTMSTNVKDLAGNPVKAGTGDTWTGF